MTMLTSPRLTSIPVYEPGLTMAEVMAKYGLSSVIKLASNESPYPVLPQVAEVVRAGVDGLTRYPDAYGRELRGLLADQHNVDLEQVVLGNGSGELILLAGQALLDPGTSVVYADPSFAIYPHVATAAGARAHAIPLADDGGHDLWAMAAAVDADTRLVIICNPNNPTGVYRSAAEIEEFLDNLPEDLPVLVDEAYNDFVALPDRGRILSMARERPSLLVTRTFSKAFGLPGLRVGYGVGSREWVQALNKVRPPFNTNSLGQAAALAALKRRSAIERQVAELIAERTRLEDTLTRLSVAFTPSQANFVLIDAGSSGEDAANVHENLLREGVIVRNGAALGVPGRLRVTLGTRDENDAFIDAFGRIAGQGSQATGAEGLKPS